MLFNTLAPFQPAYPLQSSWQTSLHEFQQRMAPVYAVDNGWHPLPPLVDVAQAVVDLPQNFSFWSSCDAEWHYPGESEIPVLGSIAVDEGRPRPTLRRDQRTVLSASLPAAVFFKDSNSEIWEISSTGTFSWSYYNQSWCDRENN